MNKRLIAYVDKLPGWLTTPEGAFLESAAKTTKKLDGVIVEIGSFCGKSTIWLSQGKSKIYAIDPHKGNVGDGQKYPPTFHSFLKNIKTAGADKYIEPIVKPSEHAAKGWKQNIKVLFIDGLHDETNATLDFKLWSKHVVDGGVIAVHDSYKRWCGSEKMAIKKILLSNGFNKVGAVDSITYGIKGKSTFIQSIQRTLNAIYLIANVYANRFKIVILHAPEIVSKTFFNKVVVKNPLLLLFGEFAFAIEYL